jgi:hypothetical protein
VQILKHSVTQVFNKLDWDEVICMVSRSDRGFKVGIAFEFQHPVLSFLTLDFLIQASLLSLLHNLSFNSLQLYWSEDHLTLADRPDVYLEFPRLLDDVVE